MDVWDGASLLQIGTARVPLSALLRRATEKVGNAATVKEYLTCDVVETRLTSIDAAPSADAAALTPPLLKGRIKLVLARLSAGTRRAAGGPAADYGAPTGGAAGAADGGKVRGPVRIYVYVCVCVCVCMCVRMRVCVYMYIYIHPYISTYTYIYIYIDIDIDIHVYI